MPAPKKDCEVKSRRACNNQIVRLLTGPRKKDPKFWCCIGCWADLRMSGVRLKEVAEEKRR